MTTTQHSIGAIGWRLVIAGIAPFAMVSAFTILSRWPSYHPTPAADWLGLVIAILVGVVALATLPARLNVRIVSLGMYVPIIGFLLFVYCFWIVGLLFGEFL